MSRRDRHSPSTVESIRHGRGRRLAGLAVAVAAAAAAFVGAGPAAPASADDCAVPVVVTFDRLPNASGIQEGCSTDPQNAAEALYRAGFSITIDTNSLKICDINSAPGDNCESADHSAGWSHWVIPAGGSDWEKTSRDVTARDPMPGDVEGWSYRPTADDEDVPPPAPEQTPAPEPTTPPAATTPATVPPVPTSPGQPDPGLVLPDPAVPGEDAAAGQDGLGGAGTGGSGSGGAGGSSQDGSIAGGSGGSAGPGSSTVQTGSRSASDRGIFDFFDGTPVADEAALTSASSEPTSPWLLIGMGGFVLFGATFVAWFRHRQLAATRYSRHR